LFTPSIDGLVILPNRESISDSSELLTSPAMQNLVNDIKSRYDSRLIVFDLPPLLGTDDAVAFLPYVDAVLFVIREGRVKRDQLARAMDLVQGSRVIGTVLNASDDALTSYY
jgi:Mrp family chromosome partitioning ATPase